MEVNRRGNSAGIVGVTPVVPSSPTFTPSLYSFNNADSVDHVINSSDGILQTIDLEDAEIYVEGVKLKYYTPGVQVLGHYLSYVSTPNGKLVLQSLESEESEDLKEITADFHITNIVFNGVAYTPEN